MDIFTVWYWFMMLLVPTTIYFMNLKLWWKLINSGIYLVYFLSTIYLLCLYDPMGGWVEMGVTAIFSSIHYGVFLLINLFARDILKKTN